MKRLTILLLAACLAPASVGATPPDPEPLANAAVSQYYDTCAMLVGDWTPCGSDRPVAQDQECPQGVALPMLGGGWVGDTRHNANGALQAACALAADAPPA